MNKFKARLTKTRRDRAHTLEIYLKTALTSENHHWSFSKSQGVAGLCLACYMCMIKEIDVIHLWLAFAQPYKEIKKMAKT